MKIELDDNTSIMTTLCVLILAVTAMVMHGCHQTESTTRAAYEAGLEQVQLEGSPHTRLGRKP